MQKEKKEIKGHFGKNTEMPLSILSNANPRIVKEQVVF